MLLWIPHLCNFLYVMEFDHTKYIFQLLDESRNNRYSVYERRKEYFLHKTYGIALPYTKCKNKRS